VDYGYWYAPEGRDAAQQAAFFRVEAAPQALESIFCEALGVPFSPSVDNPGQPLPDLAPFLEALAAQRARWEQGGLPPRAARFRDALRGLARP
jgi:elongation factor P hydroxylase